MPCALIRWPPEQKVVPQLCVVIVGLSKDGGKRMISAKGLTKRERDFVQRLIRERGAPAECPCCGNKSMFELYGFPPRHRARCPQCGSLERHRMMTLYLRREPRLLEGKRALHFAPENTVRRFCEPRAGEYLAGDLAPQIPGDLLLNIEAVDLPDQSLDLIICSHVLEHVDDQTALSEMFRILRPGGTALLMFPIIEGWDVTYENSEIVTPESRLVHFGQEDHVRYFGRDVRDRIRNVGFDLTEFNALTPDVLTYALTRGEKIFIASRPTAQNKTPDV